MNHHDHVNLIRDGIVAQGGLWADFGSGRGAFTLALADCLQSRGTIYSVDRDNGALRGQQRTMRKQFPRMAVEYISTDFAGPLDLPALDGILMANSLHFVADKLPVLDHILGLLKPEGRLILVEYNTDRGNRWVPHPMSYDTWQSLADRAGFTQTSLLRTRPSSFLGEFFSAISIAPPANQN